MSEEGEKRDVAEEEEEESFEKMIDLETAEEEVGWSVEEVEVPRISFSIDSLETMVGVEELLLKALNNPEAVDEVVKNISKLREGFSTRRKKAEQKTKTKKSQKTKTSKSKSKE